MHSRHSRSWQPGVALVSFVAAVLASILKNVFTTLAGDPWNWATFFGDLVLTAFLATLATVISDAVKKAEQRRMDDARSRELVLRLAPVLLTSVDPSHVTSIRAEEANRAQEGEEDRVHEAELLRLLDASTEFDQAAKVVNSSWGGQRWTSSEQLDAWFMVGDYAMAGARDRRLAAVEWAARDFAGILETAGPRLAGALTSARSTAFAVADQARWTDVEMRRRGLPSIEQIDHDLNDLHERTSEAELQTALREMADLAGIIRRARGGSEEESDAAEAPADGSGPSHHDRDEQAADDLRFVVQLLASERMRLERWGAAVANVIRASREADGEPLHFDEQQA